MLSNVTFAELSEQEAVEEKHQYIIANTPLINQDNERNGIGIMLIMCS